MNLFYEPSTRTYLSFQQAAHALGLTVLDFTVERSSVQKGESLVDTLQTLDAVSEYCDYSSPEDCHFLNYGFEFEAVFNQCWFRPLSSSNQALLVALTIQQSFGTLNGLKVTIIGDIFHSRVAHSMHIY